MEKSAPESESMSPSEAGGATVLDSPSSKLPVEVKSEVAVKAFRSQRGLLLNLVRHCLPSLANSLLARDIIPKDVFEDVCNQTVNKSQRCADLLECMEDTIYAIPSLFIEIIRVLESEPFLKKVTFELVHSYNCNNSSTSVDSCPPQVSSAISHYRAYLKAVYSNSSVSQDSKWPPTPSREYITLAVVEGRHKVSEDYIGHTLQGDVSQMLNMRRKILMEQILETNRKRLILIEGAPGIGKSTLAWELCRKWEEFSSMQQYSLVVLLRLREAEVQKISSVGDLFCSYEGEDKLFMKEMSNLLGKGVLFILDGFDELPRYLQTEGFLLNLIRGSVLPESTVLVTSRPSATAEFLTSCQPDKHIEILGFTQESVEAYASSVFKSQPDQLERFKTFISASNNPAINSLMYVPLNAAIIVQIFCDTESDSFLPHTLTELYTQLCITILNRHLKANCLSVKVERFKDLPAEIHNQFLELSKLAFEGFKKEVVIFHTLPSDFVHFGFLDAVSALYGGGGVSCNFLHLTMQEFLAAYYISSLGSDGLKFFSSAFSSKRRWNVVLRFLAGITGHCESIFEKYYDSYVSTFFIQCLFEAQGHRKQCVPPYHLPHPVTLELTNTYSPLDMYALGYCIANSLAGASVTVKITNLSLCLQPLIQGLKSHTPYVSDFKELHIRKCWYVFPELCKLLLNLTFDGCKLTDKNLIHLSELIPHMKFLTELVISPDPNTLSSQQKCYEGCLKVLQSLSHSNVTTLKMMNCGICFNSCILGVDSQLLVSALEQLVHPSFGKIKELHIGDGDSSNPYLYHKCHILNVLFANSSLHGLHLISPCQSSLHLLAHNTCLTELDIHCRAPLYLDGITEILTRNKTLTHMFLAYFDVFNGVKDLKAVARSLKGNSTIQCLTLGVLTSSFPYTFVLVAYEEIKAVESDARIRIIYNEQINLMANLFRQD